MSTPTTPPRTTLPPPQSTPFKTGGSSALFYTTTQKYRIESCTALADEIAPYLVGPMPADQFLKDFFPLHDIHGLEHVPPFTSGCYCSTVKASKEVDAYEPFVDTTKGFIPRFQVVNSSQSLDRNSRSDFPFKIKPDISIYRSDLPIADMTDSSLAEIFIEFKWQPSDDPFCDVTDDQKFPKSFLRRSNAARDTLGQITSYAAAQLGSQFRTHIYSVFIVRDKARLLRWDRSGTIVTEAIEYNKSPFLVDFFRRYSKALPKMCGQDQSVSAVMPTEADEARRALQLDNEIPLIKLAVPVTEQLSRYFITCPPRAALYTPAGRATRGFCAYDISERKAVFLKDSWRIDLKDIHPEGSIYEVLEHHQVPHVPHCLISGDISTYQYHATKTSDYYYKSSWACHSDAHFVPHRHYRLVLDIIGVPLTKFGSSYEMVTAIRDALHAHAGAWDAGILHRDISPGNIIIGPDRRGWLIDWDLSKPRHNENERETPRRATRTGTWQFMSAGLVAGNQTQDNRDDLESSLYTLLWVAVMYLKCPNPDRVVGLLNEIFEPHPGIRVTGSKEDFLQGRSFLKVKLFPDPPALFKLVRGLAVLFASRYHDGDEPSNTQETGDANSSPTSTTSVSEYNQRTSSQLIDHSAVIKLFDAALQDRSEWPVNDAAERQQYHGSKKVLDGLELKTGWCTIQYVETSKDVEMKDAQNEDAL